MALPPILSKHPQKSSSRFPAVGLQTLLLGFFTGVAVIPILFLDVWVYSSALTATEQDVVEKHQLLAQNISDELAGYADDLEALFRDRSQGNPKSLSEEGQQLLRSKQIQMVAFVKDDEPTYSMGDAAWLPQGGMSALQSERRLAWLRPGETRISPVLINRRDEPSLYLLRVNDVRCLTVAAISTEHFRQIQKRVSFGSSGHAAIVDQNGNVLAHPMREWEKSAKNLAKLEPIVRMKEQDEGIVKFYSPAVEADMIAGYALVPQTGWGVMIPQNYSEVRAQANRTKYMALVVSLLGLGLAIMVSWQLTRYILWPIQAVIQSAQSLESGESSRPLTNSLSTAHRQLPKELAHLLTTFDQMAAEVSTVRITLEQRVKERTQKLSEEVNRRKQLEQQLIQQATHDALTGLPNRRLLIDRLESLIALSQRSDSLFAVLFLDLDGFKQVNDTYGHKTGDVLLVKISDRLKGSLRKSDAIFRLGGDEFVILVERIATPQKAQRLTTMLTEKLIEALRLPLLIDCAEISIGVSIGIKISSGRKSAQQILSDADDAMYQAKLKGNCAIIYGAGLLQNQMEIL